MLLTRKQEEGLRVAVERYNSGEPYTVISGYAGAGKSTLIKFIISALDVNPIDEVCYVAFTGKAATVLQQKGCPNATTAHKLLYKAKPMPNGTYKFTAKDYLGEYKVIVVDEVSMLPRPMWEQLLTHGIYVLACGDPGQLPPVDKDADNHVLDNPHVFLDEIMRQAQDSEIIRLSMWVREGKSLSTFPVKKEQVQIISPGELVSGMYDWADQVLCATNQKRNDINTCIRKQKGYGEEPCVGDKIISLRNHWDDVSALGTQALTNGCIGEIVEYHNSTIYVPYYISNDPIKYMHTTFTINDTDDMFKMMPIDYKALTTGTPALDGKQTYKLNRNKNYPDAPYDFAYAYAITVWKAQGSEWDKILAFEEGHPFDKEEHQKYLYTAITRAKEKLVMVKRY